MIWYLLCLCSLLLECTATTPEAYKMYDFATWCHPEGGKNVIKLKTGTAIFTLDERNPVTANILDDRDISCHIELETYQSDYGFHIFFDELDIDEFENSVLDGPKPTTCQDYVQFGRDVFYFTTSKSRKFCGYRERIFYHNATQADYARASRQGSRLFIENADHEMDVWLKVKSTEHRSRKQKRHLRLIVTVFKKGCSSTDMYWRKCDNTNYCVRKGHFCDNYANCGWPDGEVAADETQKLCSNVWKNNRETAGQTGDIFSSSNIPTIIIVSVIVLGAFFLLVFGMVRAIGTITQRRRKNNGAASSSALPSSRDSQRRENRRVRPQRGFAYDREGTPLSEDCTTTETRERQRLSLIDADVTPTLLHHMDPGGGIPSDPPSYDEVVQVPYVPSAPMDYRSDPPPYSTTIS